MARRHWNRIVKEYELTVDASMILATALENWDTAEEAGRLIRKEGLIVAGKRHPALEIKKTSTLIFLRSMRELGLNIADPGDVGRPPQKLAASPGDSQEALNF
jgi:phage terminase small subunit